MKLSAFEQVLRSTDATKASEKEFDLISKRHGFRRPENWSIEAWRSVLHAGQWGARGTLGTTHDILENLFRPWNRSCVVRLGSTEKMNGTSGENRHTISWYGYVGDTGHMSTFNDVTKPIDTDLFFSNDDGGHFGCVHTNRLVRIWYLSQEDMKGNDPSKPGPHFGEYVQTKQPDGFTIPFIEDVSGNKLYDPILTAKFLPWKSALCWAYGPYLSGTAKTNELLLSPVNTGYWEGADWLNGQKVFSKETVDGSGGFPFAVAQFLPFRYREPTPGPLRTTLLNDTQQGDPCKIELELDISAFDIPSRYLMDPGGVDKATYVPNAPPFGPHIMDELNVSGSLPDPPDVGDPLGNGAHPLYFHFDADGGSSGKALENIIDPHLAAGVEIAISYIDWCKGKNG
tara:strand:- start:71 stop:1267 length:1197 start_codon:yes stop_codon:yes gene_type:complete